MATLLKIDKVQYLIEENKEESLPLARLYFCIYCMSLKSPDALQLEIDCHFCPQTLDSLPPGEASQKKNKSANSWQCPFCFHTLSSKASTTSVVSADDPNKIVPKKSYYQLCNFCRWSSRSAKIPDKDTVSSGWSEVENPHQSRIDNLLDYYKSLSSKELAELEQKKSPKKKGYYNPTMQQLQQKYGTSSLLTRKHFSSLPSNLSELRLKEPLKQLNIIPATPVGLDSVEKLPDDIYSKPVDFTQMSSIEQRLDQASVQTSYLIKAMPRRSAMLVKRSLRCKSCDHYIIKPEYNASSIKFKINLGAIQHVPELRINQLSNLEPGKKSKITLSFINPTENLVHVNLFPNTEGNANGRINTKIEFPSTSLVLSKYDETAEYAAVQEGNEDMGKDDPNVVAFRYANKLGFFAYVTPDDELSRDSEMWTSFTFKHDHHGTVPIVQILKSSESEKKPEVVWLTQTVYIKLGKFSEQ